MYTGDIEMEEKLGSGPFMNKKSSRSKIANGDSGKGNNIKK